MTIFSHPFILVSFALIAFAGNSVLCRLALKNAEIDPISFTSIRLLSGALCLFILITVSRLTSRKIHHKKLVNFSKNNWFGAFSLTVYAFAFSFAYIYLETGSGALLLFAAVQGSMLLYSITKVGSPTKLELGGMLVAFSGLVFILWPEIGTPSIFGAGLMLLAGIAWAVFTVLGKKSTDPLEDTAKSFILATLPVILVMALFNFETHMTNDGVIYAVCSGVLASAIGYALWYSALKYISVLQAGVLQLSVPIIAAIGGLIWSSEEITVNFSIAATLTLFGIYLTLLPKRAPKEAP